MVKSYLNMLEEADKRDHRKIGKDLKLFHIDDTVGQGLVLWTPNGAIIRQALQDFISEELQKQGYKIPEYRESPESDEEKDAKARYAHVPSDIRFGLSFVSKPGTLENTARHVPWEWAG